MFRRSILAFVSLLIVGCDLSESPQLSQQPAIPRMASSSSKAQTAGFNLPSGLAASGTAVPRRAPCTAPSGWIPYQMHLNETIYSLAVYTPFSADDLLKANCLTAPTEIGPGSWVYVPPETPRSSASTFLPLGISALVADPQTVSAGGLVNLTWQTQGPVVRVRIGWMYQNQFIEEVGSLPSTGTWQLQAPADGRESITYMVRVSDGLQEIAAQTTVQIRCPESWYFSPQPSGCPSAPLITTFHEQHFERGTIVYIPALGEHYVLIVGQAGIRLSDPFVPGMPLKDQALDAQIPAGLRQPTGPINYAWRSDDTIAVGLGYAIGEENHYLGMMQRTVNASGEVLYFSSGSGQVYRFVSGQAWQLFSPQ